jgi:protein required for attachment to host cells
MRIPHDTVVLVADGRKMLFFRNEGEADMPTLSLIRQDEQENPKHGDQATDSAGQGPGSSRTGGIGGGDGGRGWVRGSMEEVDFHQQAEDRFAAETAEMLKKRAMAGEYDHLIVVAPPKTLGELRKHYHHEVTKRLTGELAKDLTGHPVDQIGKLISDAE